MRCASSLLSAAIALACLSSLAHGYTCFSEELYKSKIRSVRSLARKTDMPPASVWCLYQKGMAFQPEMVEFRPGWVEPCYKDTTAIKYMVDAMADCIAMEDLKDPERQARIRRPIKPDTPLRSVAHWLGLEETVRQSCHCLSGCHYCCVQTGLGGHDYCFDVYCYNGQGRCY